MLYIESNVTKAPLDLLKLFVIDRFKTKKFLFPNKKGIPTWNPVCRCRQVNTCVILSDILAAILNCSNPSKVAKWHHPDLDS